MDRYDFIIVGAGVVGAMIARELSKFELKILMIERESDVGMGQSAANSAIIHAGYDPKPGTLKAALNSRGNKLWHSLANELDIPLKKTGSYVAAIGKEELPVLDQLFAQGAANGIPQMKIIGREEMLIREPLINPNISGALWAPTAAVIDPFAAVLAPAENAVANGVQVLLETELIDFIRDGKRIQGVITSRGGFSCRWVINSTGIHSDEVMHKAGIRPEFGITPKKGEYLLFDSSRFSLNNVLFQVPTEKGKGVLVSTTVHGNVMIGPNSELIERKEDSSATGAGINEVLEGAKKLIPSLNSKYVIAMYAGIRAAGSAGKDFVIEIPEGMQGIVNLGGIDSPGLASAPAIAEMVLDLLKEAGEEFVLRKNWNPARKAKPVFHLLSHLEKAELIRKNPAYGRIVCRCEEITEGEVLDAIRSPIPAGTYDAVKRRTWLGTGRCQGSFDHPRVIDIIANELKIPVTGVTKKGTGSELIFRTTK